VNDKEIRDHITEAAVARCDLNVLYGVVALLEGGTMSSECQVAIQRIIATCQREGQKCLRRYDKAIDRALKAKRS